MKVRKFIISLLLVCFMCPITSYAQSDCKEFFDEFLAFHFESPNARKKHYDFYQLWISVLSACGFYEAGRSGSYWYDVYENWLRYNGDTDMLDYLDSIKNMKHGDTISGFESFIRSVKEWTNTMSFYDDPARGKCLSLPIPHDYRSPVFAGVITHIQTVPYDDVQPFPEEEVRPPIFIGPEDGSKDVKLYYLFSGEGYNKDGNLVRFNFYSYYKYGFCIDDVCRSFEYCSTIAMCTKWTNGIVQEPLDMIQSIRFCCNIYDENGNVLSSIGPSNGGGYLNISPSQLHKLPSLYKDINSCMDALATDDSNLTNMSNDLSNVTLLGYYKAYPRIMSLRIKSVDDIIKLPRDALYLSDMDKDQLEKEFLLRGIHIEFEEDYQIPVNDAMKETLGGIMGTTVATAVKAVPIICIPFIVMFIKRIYTRIVKGG